MNYVKYVIVLKIGINSLFEYNILKTDCEFGKYTIGLLRKLLKEKA